MAESLNSQTASTLIQEELRSINEEDFSGVMGDYSIPNISSVSNSLFVQSQYAKVIFHDLADTYLTDADICCRYSLTNGIFPTPGDKIALYTVGWSKVEDYILFEWAPLVSNSYKSEMEVLFKADLLPKDVNEYYQLCYLKENTVCGASIPFQFRHPNENDLCAVEDQDGLLVFRSRSALADEKLRKALTANEELKKNNKILEEEVSSLLKKSEISSDLLTAASKDVERFKEELKKLELKVAEANVTKCLMEKLENDKMGVEREKVQVVEKLTKAEQRIEFLTSTVNTLTADKEKMAYLLRSGSQESSAFIAEISQYKAQVDSLSHMLEALTQSKELVAQELRIQQATNQQLLKENQTLMLRNKELERTISELESGQISQESLKEALNEAVAARDSLEEKMQSLEKVKQQLLSQLVQVASLKEWEVNQLKESYENKLKSASEVATTLEQQALQNSLSSQEKLKNYNECTQMVDSLSKKLQLTEKYMTEKEEECKKLLVKQASLEADAKRNIEIHRQLLQQNERLSSQIKEYENAAAACKLHLEETNIQQERQSRLGEISEKLQEEINILESLKKELETNKSVQLERISTIVEQLAIMNKEKETLCAERVTVANCRRDFESELAMKFDSQLQMRERTEADFSMPNYNFEETIDRLTQYADSSKVRVQEIDDRVNEIEEIILVLGIQHSEAIERNDDIVKREEEIAGQLLELTEQQKRLSREQAGNLTTMRDLLDHALTEEFELFPSLMKEDENCTHKDNEQMLQKLENKFENQEQCSSLGCCLDEDKELKKRLELAADEYKKLFSEKQKVERKLARIYQKLSEKKAKLTSSPSPSEQSTSDVNSSSQPATAELISLSQGVEVGDIKVSARLKCPFCSVTFPSGAFDLYRQHFESHIN